jgi:hypothetical protein
MANLDKAFALTVLKHETGTYDTDKRDKGNINVGSKYGVNDTSFEDYYKRKATPDDIRNLTKAQAHDIAKWVWNRYKLGDLNDQPTANILFDWLWMTRRYCIEIICKEILHDEKWHDYATNKSKFPPGFIDFLNEHPKESMLTIWIVRDNWTRTSGRYVATYKTVKRRVDSYLVYPLVCTQEDVNGIAGIDDRLNPCKTAAKYQMLTSKSQTVTAPEKDNNTAMYVGGGVLLLLLFFGFKKK